MIDKATDLHAAASAVAAAVRGALPDAESTLLDTFVESRSRTVHTVDSAYGQETIQGEESGVHVRLLSGADVSSVVATGAMRHLAAMVVGQLSGRDSTVDLPEVPGGQRVASDGGAAEEVMQVARELRHYAEDLRRAVGVASFRIILSELRRQTACERDGGVLGDVQTRRRLHLQLGADDGGVGEDGITLASVPGLPDADVVRPVVERALRRARAGAQRTGAPEGKHPVVFTEAAAGVVLHELVGHLLEADVIAAGGDALASRLGTKVSREALTVVDDPTLPDRWGSFRIDDEGQVARRTSLIIGGVVHGILTDRTLGNSSGAHQSGNNARRASHAYRPLPRMSNLSASPGTDRLDEVIGSLRRGVYCDGLTRGQVDPGTGRFTLNMTSGRAVRGGQLREHLRPMILTGDVLAMLDSLAAVCDDPDDMQTICGKEGQQVLVEMVAPSMLFTDVEVSQG